MTEEVQELVQRCLALSPALQWLNDPANTTTVMILMLTEFALHSLVFCFVVWNIGRLLGWFVRGLIWIGRMSWYQWQVWRAPHA